MSRVVIVDDHPGFRDRLERFVGQQHGCTVVGSAGDHDAGYRVVLETRPDVVIIDVGLPRENGLSLAHRLAQNDDAPRVVLMGDNEADEYARAAEDLGAQAYVSKTEISDRLPPLLSGNGGGGSGRGHRHDFLARAVGASGGQLFSSSSLAMRPLRYVGWEAGLASAALVTGIVLNYPASALGGAVGLAFLSYRQVTLPRLRRGAAGKREPRRARGAR